MSSLFSIQAVGDVDLPFWSKQSSGSDCVALFDEISGARLTYAGLAASIREVSSQLSGPRKKLIFAPLDNCMADVLLYLGLLASRHAIYLYNHQSPVLKVAELIEIYKPDLVFGSASSVARQQGYKASQYDIGHDSAEIRGEGDIYPELALLLSTSGTTGTSKLARISYANIQSASYQFRKAVAISPGERAITSVPLAYIYGLSFLHSYISAGASLVVTRRSVMEPEFWGAVGVHQVTTFAGVPWTYQTISHLGIDAAKVPSLNTLTISGGKIDPESIEYVDKAFPHARVFNMYGQTEACGRIAVLQRNVRFNKNDSVGKVVAGGHVSCDADGSVKYRGPNVMLGYANSAADLKSGDTLGGILDTGDIGHLDKDGYLYISGRRARFCKIMGHRINLDDIELYFRREDVEIIAFESPAGEIRIQCVGVSAERMTSLVARLASDLWVPRGKISFEEVGELQRTNTGKLRYPNRPL